MKKKNIPKIIPILGTVGALIIIILMFVLFARYAPSNTKADLYDYFGVLASGDASGDSPLPGEEAAIVADGELLEEKAFISNEQPYVNIAVIQERFNDHFYWDDHEKLLLYALPSRMIRTGAGTALYSDGGENNEFSCVIAKYVSGALYISMDFVKNYTDIDYQIYEAPDRIVIRSAGTFTYVDAKKNAKIRVKGGIKSDILKECEKGEKLTVIEELDKWVKVSSRDGLTGYIKTSAVSDSYEEESDSGFDAEQYDILRPIANQARIFCFQARRYVGPLPLNCTKHSIR